MKKNIILSSFFLCAISVEFLAGCAQNISVQFPPHTPNSNNSQLALIPPQQLYLKSVIDSRTPGRAEGSREAAFGVPMGNVQFKPPVSDIVRDIITSEFTTAGHSFTDKDQGLDISAKILIFEVGTNTTPLYWDIIGNTKIEIEVMDAERKQIEKTYTSTCQDRTYVWPGGDLVKKVMENCMNDFAKTMRNDKELANAIRSIPQ
jgi:uncharacterized lipoprotein YajG